jgi:hypothetical protein
VIAFAFALARAWVRLYTRGVAAPLRDRRRAEIASDLWEQRHDQRDNGRPAILVACDVVGRVAGGAPSDLAWRMEHGRRGRVAHRLRHAGAVARLHRWTVFPALLVLVYVTGVAKLGTPSVVGTPQQIAMAVGATAILAGMVLLWRAVAPVPAAWIVCLGALAPVLLIARSAPLSIVWAALAMRAAVRRSDVVRAGPQHAALPKT